MVKEFTMDNDPQIRPGDIATGVTHEEFKARAKEIYESVVRPQVEARKHRDSNKKLELSPAQKALANCHSPY